MTTKDKKRKDIPEGNQESTNEKIKETLKSKTESRVEEKNLIEEVSSEAEEECKVREIIVNVNTNIKGKSEDK